MNMVYYGWAQFPLYDTVHKKQLMQAAPIVHYRPLFCIAPRSVHLVGSVVVENELVFEPDGE